MNNKKLAVTTIIITAVLLLSKLSGFLRDVALAYAYGTSFVSDAFVLSMTILSIFSAVFSALVIAFMPIYKELSLNSGQERKHFVDSSYTLIFIFVCIMSFVFVWFSGWIVEALAPGFKKQAFDTAVVLTKILLVTVPMSFIITLGGQHLRAENSFIVAAAVAIPLNLILIFTFTVMAPVYGTDGVAWMYVLGAAVQLVWIVAMLVKRGYNYAPSFDIHNEGLRKILILTMPILMGNAIQIINTIVDRMLASGLAEGSMAALNFSNKLAVFVISIISLGAGNVCYTKMSELGAEGKNKELADFLKSVINLLNIIVVPATVGMMVLSVPIIQTVFEYGAFNSNSSQLTATALYFYALGLVGYSLRDMITRAFYALQDSKTPMINGIVAVVVNIVLNLILVRVMGISGLALATSISAIFGTVLLLISLRKKLGAIGGKEMCATFLKCVIATVIMGIAAKYTYELLLPIVHFVPVSLFVSIFLGMVIYGILILFMNIKEVEIIKNYIKKKTIR